MYAIRKFKEHKRAFLFNRNTQQIIDSCPSSKTRTLRTLAKEIEALKEKNGHDQNC